jgi:diguanylate cyclase (GGDEF)-like protein
MLPDEGQDGQFPILSLRGIGLLVGAIALYLVAVPLASLTVFPEADIALFWFPIAIFVGLIARLPYRWLPALTVAVLVAEFIAAQVFRGVDISTVGLWMLATAVEAVVVGVLLKLGMKNQFGQPLDVLKFAVIVPVAVLLSAAIGGLAISASFGTEWSQGFQEWWLGDVSGILIAAPFVMLIRIPKTVSTSQVLEYLAMAALTIAATAWIFLKPTKETNFNLWAALLVPILGWVALSFGVVAVSSIAPVVVFVAAVSGANSLGPFEGVTPGVEVLIPTQAFLVLTCLSAYAAGTVAEAYRRAEAMLHAQAFADPLTGLPNRRALLDRINRPPQSSGREESRAVFFCDLRGFKQVNDTLGHAAGDEALLETANRLEIAVGNRGTVSRFGGDEFVVLVERFASPEQIERLAARIVDLVGQPMRISGQDQVLGVDIGVAIESPDVRRSEQLVIRADVALLEAKQDVEASIVFYTDVLARQLQARVDSMSLVRNALDRGEVEMWLQPVVSPLTGEVTGAEALARIRTGDGTIHPPASFIDEAEQSGLIVGLGYTMLDQALDWLLAHKADHSDFHVAVNVSVRQLYELDFARRVGQALASRGLDASKLVLEVTERMVVARHSPTVGVLEDLRTQGVRVSIDDFGTGYASFTALRQLPADIVKIDRSFISGIQVGKGDLAITSAIIHVAHDLDRVVVAEGVESLEQAQIVSRLGAESIQGFYYSRPVHPTEFRFEPYAPVA